MFTLLLTIHIIISILLILVVLMQVGRGAEMGAAFGSVNQANYPQTPENFLGKLTTYLAIIFMVLSITLALIGNKSSSGSVLEKYIEEIPTTSAPATDTNGTTKSEEKAAMPEANKTEDKTIIPEVNKTETIPAPATTEKK